MRYGKSTPWMIVKFHPRGAGRGSGPVEYLLGKHYDRDGATLDSCLLYTSDAADD